MPVPWLLLQAASLPAWQEQVAPKQMTQTVGGVTFVFKSFNWDKKSDDWTFTKGVVVKYDVTTIHADTVKIQQKSQHASATGHVHVDDPTGTIDSNNIEMWWSNESRHGVINDAEVRIGSAHLVVSKMDIRPKIWTMTNVRGTTSRANPPWYEVRSPLVTIYPGKFGKMKRPTLFLMGQRIATFPDHTFNLDPRSEGVGFPSLSFSGGHFGTNWGGGLFVDHSTDLAFSVGAFPQALPSYGVNLTHSFLPDDKVQTILTPLSDFNEPFTEGYLEDIYVTGPNQEDGYLRTLKRSLSLDSYWNIAANGRGPGLFYSKPDEAVYEASGPLGKFGFMSQTRVQTIRQVGEDFETRMSFNDTLGFPAIHLTPNLRTLARVDSDVFIGPNQYGWIRAMAGLAYEPIKQVRLSAGGYKSVDAGQPDFIIDRLVSTQGVSFRADVNLGPTKFSYMTKYDPYLKWFDHEYTISQVIGCFEPFLLYREYPSTYNFGLRLNIGDLTDLITRRNFTRPVTAPSVISPGPDGNP